MQTTVRRQIQWGRTMYPTWQLSHDLYGNHRDTLAFLKNTSGMDDKLSFYQDFHFLCDGLALKHPAGNLGVAMATLHHLTK